MMVGSSRSLKRRRFCEESSSMNLDNRKYFTEDVLIEIFLRLPLESVYKFRCVSKLWLSILSKPYFINSICKNSFSTTMPIVYFKIDFPITKFISTVCNRRSKSLSDHDGFSLKFLHSELQKKIYLLASSNGLLLCSTTDLYSPIESKYYVCNPLTKKWVSLPPPPNCTHGWFLHGMICESSSSSSSSSVTSTTYKVVRVPKLIDTITYLDLEIFSSDLGQWNTYRVSYPQEVTILQLGSTRNLISHKGVLYWIEGQPDRIIASDLNNKNGGCQCKVIDLPEKVGDSYYRRGCLGESEGFICYGEIENKWMSVWMLEEDNSNGCWVWHLVHRIGLRDKEGYQIVAFNPVDKNVVILDRYDTILAFNIRTRRLEALGGPFSVRCSRFWNGYRDLPIVLMARPTIILF